MRISSIPTMASNYDWASGIGGRRAVGLSSKRATQHVPLRSGENVKGSAAQRHRGSADISIAVPSYPRAVRNKISNS
jgi:hypothetical protein